MAVTGMTQMGSAQTEIAKMYQQYLGRAPDQGGLDYYTNLASNGSSLDRIRQSIAGSPEAQAYTPPAQSSAVQSGLLNSARSFVPNPTVPNANSGPVLDSTSMANPNFAAAQQGDTVGGIGNTTGMGEDINWGAASTQTLSAGDIFETPAGNYQAVDNGYGQIGLVPLEGAINTASDIQYNVSHGDHHYGVNPNTGEAWYQGAQGVTPGLYQTYADIEIQAAPQAAASAAPTPSPAASGPDRVTASNAINALYQKYLGRDAEPAGLNYWLTDVMKGGSTLADVEYNITQSAEYKSLSTPTPITDPEPADDRPPPVPASQSTAAPNSPATAAQPTPSATSEYNQGEATQLVAGLYQSILGRAPEQAGLDYWVNSLVADGATLEDVRYNMFISEEFLGRATTEIDKYFNELTGRPGDPAQVESYVSEARYQSKTLGQIRDEISQSDAALEFSANGFTLEEAKNYVTALFQSVLGRAPREAGLNFWAESLSSGGAVADFRWNIFNSQEFEGRARNEITGYFTELTGQAGSASQIGSYIGEAQLEAKTLDQIRQEIYNSAAAVNFRAQQGSGSTGTGSQGSVRSAVDNTQTYNAQQAAASADAGAEDAVVVAREVSPDELVENRINNLLDGNNPYIERARTSGLQFANQRGLLNSSIAAQASEEAAIARAGEIASQDAATYANAAAQNQQAYNAAGLQDAQLGTNVSMFNVGEDNTTNRFNTQASNDARQFNAASANQAIQNFLQREQVRLLQDDQQAFTAEQNEADRVLRETLQNAQFDFTSSENSLDRNLQTALQENQFAFTGTQAELDREQQTALQDDQQAFQTAMQDDQQFFITSENQLDREQQTAMQNDQQMFIAGENILDRAQSSLLADKEITFRTWSQNSQQEWQTAQNALQLEFQYYNSNAQTATSIMYSTMEGIAQIYADPNLTASQKQNAITNLLNSANEMPKLLSTIQANVTQTQQTNAATNYDDNGVWTGEGYPNWAVPPANGTTVTPGDFPIVNPTTGQTYIAPNNGWTYVGQTTAEGGGGGGGTGTEPGGIPSGYTPFMNEGTGEPVPNMYRGPNGGLFTWNPETGVMTPININPFGGGR